MRSHGTVYTYAHGCRCKACVKAKATRKSRAGKGSRQRGPEPVDRRLLREALQEMFPMGLTDQCPARRALKP